MPAPLSGVKIDYGTLHTPRDPPREPYAIFFGQSDTPEFISIAAQAPAKCFAYPEPQVDGGLRQVTTCFQASHVTFDAERSSSIEEGVHWCHSLLADLMARFEAPEYQEQIRQKKDRRGVATMVKDVQRQVLPAHGLPANDAGLKAMEAKIWIYGCCEREIFRLADEALRTSYIRLTGNLPWRSPPESNTTLSNATQRKLSRRLQVSERSRGERERRQQKRIASKMERTRTERPQKTAKVTSVNLEALEMAPEQVAEEHTEDQTQRVEEEVEVSSQGDEAHPMQSPELFDAEAPEPARERLTRRSSRLAARKAVQSPSPMLSPLPSPLPVSPLPSPLPVSPSLDEVATPSAPPSPSPSEAPLEEIFLRRSTRTRRPVSTDLGDDMPQARRLGSKPRKAEKNLEAAPVSQQLKRQPKAGKAKMVKVRQRPQPVIAAPATLIVPLTGPAKEPSRSGRTGLTRGARVRILSDPEHRGMTGVLYEYSKSSDSWKVHGDFGAKWFPASNLAFFVNKTPISTG